MKCGPLCSAIFPICLVLCSFGGSLDTKFCLHAAGGIYVNDNFIHSGGNLSISGSSGEAWRCRAQEFLLGSLAGFWDGCRLWEINSRVWKSKRIEEISVDFHNFHQCWRQSLIANWFKSWCFVVFPFPHVSREQDGCLSLSLCFWVWYWFWLQDSRESPYVIVHDVWWVVISMMELLLKV